MLIKISKNFINDSLRTNLCLYFQPYLIALASLNMAQIYYNKKLPDMKNGLKWFQFFVSYTTEEELNEATNYIKKIYDK